jgi:hypothetical protein
MCSKLTMRSPKRRVQAARAWEVGCDLVGRDRRGRRRPALKCLIIRSLKKTGQGRCLLIDLTDLKKERGTNFPRAVNWFDTSESQKSMAGGDLSFDPADLKKSTRPQSQTSAATRKRAGDHQWRLHHYRDPGAPCLEPDWRPITVQKDVEQFLAAAFLGGPMPRPRARTSPPLRAYSGEQPNEKISSASGKLAMLPPLHRASWARASIAGRSAPALTH